MKKYGTSESLEVLHGQEAQVLNDHMTKTGKRKVSDFSDDERENLEKELQSVRDEEKSWEDEGGTVSDTD
jgi:hypothetical protein